jgi:hypothetical protein
MVSYRSVVVDQRGIALPLALILLTLLMSLTLAFLTMGTTEPTIAANLKSGEMALSAAEAGIERAIWALTNPTVDTAGANTKLTDLNNIPAAYSGQTLFALDGLRAFSVTITPGAPPNTITAHGYVVRNGVALPAQPAGLAQADIVGHRVVELRVSGGGGGNTVGGPAAGQSGSDVKLPGALTVAGSVQMAGNSTVDGNNSAPGTPNGCQNKGGVTIRDRTMLTNNSELDNTINFTGDAYSVTGTPAQQELGYADYAPFSFNDAQLAALKALAQAQGNTCGGPCYIQPTNNQEFVLTLGDGLMFVDTVNGEALGNPPDASKLANVKITGGNNRGWLIVMGSIKIDGNVTYNGFIYAHNDLSYKGTGTGGIYGGVLTGNVIDTIATVVDTDGSGNSKIYYDCNNVATGGGAFTPTIQNGLNRVIVSIVPGSWRELSN